MCLAIIFLKRRRIYKEINDILWTFTVMKRGGHSAACRLTKNYVIDEIVQFLGKISRANKVSASTFEQPVYYVLPNGERDVFNFPGRQEYCTWNCTSLVEVSTIVLSIGNNQPSPV
jgi:hypothetical protein